MRTATITGAAAVLVLSLAACQPALDDDPADVVPKTGDCFADEVVDATFGPDLSTKVPCSKKHVYEVIGSVMVPDRFVRGESRRELLRDRTRLGDLQLGEDEETFSPFQAFMAKACSQASLDLVGLGDLDINGRAAVDLLAEPAVSSASTEWFLPPKEQWLDNRTAHCAFRFDESDAFDYADADGVTAPTDEALAGQVLDPSAPPETRYCFNYEPDGEPDKTSCTKVHDGEVFLSYELDAMTGSSRLGDRADLELELTQKQYDSMTKPCLDSLAPILGPHDPDLFVDVLWGEHWFGVGRRRVQCVVTTDESSRLPGRSLIRNARDVAFVERDKPI